MSHFPDDAKSDTVRRFKENECVDCGRREVLEDREKFDYWTGYAWEKGHVGEESHLWLRHEHDWRCYECAKEFYPINTDEND